MTLVCFSTAIRQQTTNYSGVKRIDETGFECKKIKEGKEYSVTADTRVMSELKVPEGMVIVTYEITRTS